MNGYELQSHRLLTGGSNEQMVMLQAMFSPDSESAGPKPDQGHPMTVTEAVRQRISTRAFLPTPISKEDLGNLLETAQRSPSGGNLQPWKVIAVAGKEKDDIIAIAQQSSPQTRWAPSPATGPSTPTSR